jgi:2-polyprenyl-3-methyl-5-hydroxy-6-metoxy-1,4-benzoquinol methylase
MSSSPILDKSNIRPCPVCNTETPSTNLIGRLPKTFHGALIQNEYDLAYCACKSLVYISPLPPAEDLEAIYVKSEQFSDPLYTDATRVEAILEYIGGCLQRMVEFQAKNNDVVPLPKSGMSHRLGERILRWLPAVLTEKWGDKAFAELSVLEIGAGRAWMCRSAKRYKLSAKTTAQDISSEASQACDWVDNYLVCDLNDARIDAHGPFDIISITHVIEHLNDPAATIKRCKGMLAAGGVIFITAPHRPLGWKAGDQSIEPWKTYSYNHIPAHIQYFSRKSMDILAEKAGCELVYWIDQHEDGQAFEAWLQ